MKHAVSLREKSDEQIEQVCKGKSGKGSGDSTGYRFCCRERGIAVQAAGADLNDPFSFVLYTNEFVSSNLDHIEGNAAIREIKDFHGKLWGKILSGRSFCSESDS